MLSFRGDETSIESSDNVGKLQELFFQFVIERELLCFLHFLPFTFLGFGFGCDLVKILLFPSCQPMLFSHLDSKSRGRDVADIFETRRREMKKCT